MHQHLWQIHIYSHVKVYFLIDTRFSLFCNIYLFNICFSDTAHMGSALNSFYQVCVLTHLDHLHMWWALYDVTPYVFMYYSPFLQIQSNICPLCFLLVSWDGGWAEAALTAGFNKETAVGVSLDISLSAASIFWFSGGQNTCLSVDSTLCYLCLTPIKHRLYIQGCRNNSRTSFHAAGVLRMC